MTPLFPIDPSRRHTRYIGWLIPGAMVAVAILAAIFGGLR